MSGTYPALDDAEGWKRHVAASEAMIMKMFMRGDGPACAVRDWTASSARAYELVPDGLP